MSHTMLKNIVIHLALIAFALALLGGCALPTLNNRSISSALPQTQAMHTRIGRAVESRISEHDNESGIHLLGNPLDAFAARMLLAAAAEQTLDVQYYIWHGDSTGTLLLSALYDAAGRGVRVRLLLDDHGTGGLDKDLAALNSHPNVEVRLFNPFATRRAKWLGFITNFMRANRRMHNKSFTADNSATVIGGRNIADEYFGATTGVLKQDLDLLAVGSVVADVSSDFDKYWASQSAYPAERLLANANADSVNSTVSAWQELSPERESYLKVVRDTLFVRDLLQGELPLEWARTKMVSDNPAKGLGRVNGHKLLINHLPEVLGQPQSDLLLVSPYFVPTAAGVNTFVALADKGVNVEILTNAMEATDVLPVHAGYAKRRKALLKAGVKLYELRQLSSEVKRNTIVGTFGSSASSLHAKTFAVDRERIFIGSFNFDPRSMHLNTELGFVIESPMLASLVQDEFQEQVKVNAYEVKLDQRGKLYWVEYIDGKEQLHATEPGATLGRRIAIRILTFLPIEWLL